MYYSTVWYLYVMYLPCLSAHDEGDSDEICIDGIKCLNVVSCYDIFYQTETMLTWLSSL